jgi:hypothetical protein
MIPPMPLGMLLRTSSVDFNLAQILPALHPDGPGVPPSPFPCSSPAYYALPVPSSDPFTHPTPNANNIPTAMPSFGPGVPPSPPSTIPLNISRVVSPASDAGTSSTDPYPAAFPPALHSNVFNVVFPTSDVGMSSTDPYPAAFVSHVVSGPLPSLHTQTGDLTGRRIHTGGTRHTQSPRRVMGFEEE